MSMSNPKDPFVEVPAGATVFKQGDAGNDMYIVESGQIDLLLTGGGEPLDSLGPGDFFGEAEMLEDQPRLLTALAKGPARLLRIERAAFADVLRQNAEIAVHMLRNMAARQRRTESIVQNMLVDSGKARAAAAAPRAPVQPTPPAAAPAPRPPAAREAVPAPAPAPPAVKPAPVVAATPAVQTMVLRHGSGQIFPLDAALSEFLVGRLDPVTGTQPELDLGTFDVNRTLSRRHAKIVREGALYFVRDEGGANGTFVNGERVNMGESVALKPGDKLRFGSIEVELGLA